jgi:Cu-processing system ATP-binding protein
VIEVENVYKEFGKNKVLRGIDLKIKGGGIYAVLGPNGSGKTTLIKCILGMVIPSAGMIRVMDMPVRNKWKYRNSVNYLPQIANFPGNLKVQELFSMISDLRHRPERKEELISLFGLAPYLNKKLSTLSGGTKQKVNIVLTFMFNSPLLILDEPTNGLDPAALIALKKLVQEEKTKGNTILITSHIMQFVEEVADEIIYLLEGEVYFKGSVSALKEKTGSSDFEHAIVNIATKFTNA